MKDGVTVGTLIAWDNIDADFVDSNRMLQETGAIRVDIDTREMALNVEQSTMYASNSKPWTSLNERVSDKCLTKDCNKMTAEWDRPMIGTVLIAPVVLIQKHARKMH